jgi:hypothetical protein
MSREVYIPRDFRGRARGIIDHANAIIEEYRARGLKVSLRQLYYQFVARAMLTNTLANYKLLGRTMVNARDAGQSDWDAVEDRTREVNFHPSWSGPQRFLREVVPQYAEDLWHSQSYRPEVWIEKEALLGVIADVCERWRVPSYAMKGNSGQLLMHEAGQRFAAQLSQGQTPVVLYLGDHDPTGIEMTNDVEKRVPLYTRSEEVVVKRLALNMSQVRRHRPPPNYAKEKDRNLAKYIEQFDTRQCWELDALPPDVIIDLIDREVERLIDQKAWAAAVRKEQRNGKLLSKLEVK